MNNGVLTVSALNFYIKTKIEEDINLNQVFIEGEITNFKRHYQSGHIYFSLKDSKSAIRCVMFSSYATRLKFNPDNDMKVIANGKISVYEKDGQYQLYCYDIQPYGIGALSIAYEQLKRKLTAEGFFDDEHKKPIPLHPQRIAVLTSDTGAAVNDIISTANRRNPLVQIIVCPVIVQGDTAPESIIKMLKKIENLSGIDTVIIGRGGGSFEDLFCFNDEQLVRTIYDFPIPVISAVGHENDFTFCDFVSDLRAATPTAAAELAVPQLSVSADSAKDYFNRIKNYVHSRVLSEEMTIDGLTSSSVLAKRDLFINIKETELKNVISKISVLSQKEIEGKIADITTCFKQLEALNPLSVLARGYSVVLKDGKALTTAENTDIGDNIDVFLNNGKLKCKVLSKE